ncbi:MAG: flagellar basal-body rod protein FlgG [Thermoguttaceae bacterium]
MSIQALYTAATGMNSMQAKLDVIANNLANTETTGFKADRANFEDLFYRQEKYPGSQDSSGAYTPTGIATGTGSRLQSTQSNFTQGSLQQTGSQLDVAIQGQGFFQIRDPASGTILYSRAGNFSRNANGQIVMGSANIGRLLEPNITIPNDATSISVSTAGVVSYQTSTSQALQQAGTIQLANFINPQGLLKIGENLYQETDSSGAAQTGAPGSNGFGTTQQSSLEQSNVDPVSSLIDLITTQRAFEMNSQTIQAGNECWQTINNLIK